MLHPGTSGALWGKPRARDGNRKANTVTGDEHFFDNLSASEGEFCEEIIDRLNGEAWAAPLLAALSGAGGICREAKSFLFELRFANALHEAGVVPDYEIPGEGSSTIDFGFEHGGQRWAVELMRLEETAAAIDATKSTTDATGTTWISRNLSSTAKDKRQTEEGETVKAVQRICQKCEKDGRPYKFPEPTEAYNVILVDFRTFLHGGDEYDRIHVALGGKCLKSGFLQRFFKGKLISGVFDKDTMLKGANEAQERVHFIGFVKEKKYESGEFAQCTQFVANPRLFKSEEEVLDAIAKWSLQPAEVLNVKRKNKKS